MTTHATKIDLSTFISVAFSKKALLSKGELLHWLEDFYPDVAEETLVWRIHDLKNRGVLESPGRGMYRLGKTKTILPVFGDIARRIAAELARELPLVKTCIWETRWISGWMELQSPSNWTIVEVEKEVLEYVFNILTGLTDKVFLDPDRKVVDLYVLPLNEAVVVKPLLSEAPTMTVGEISAAAPEKILVDIVAEPNLFRAQQGELDRIYANAFREIPLNQTKMLRYARRRRKDEVVFDLIPVEYRLPQTAISHR